MAAAAHVFPSFNAGGVVAVAGTVMVGIADRLAVERRQQHAESAVAAEAVLDDLGGGDVCGRRLAMRPDMPDQVAHHADGRRNVLPAHGADGNAPHGRYSSSFRYMMRLRVQARAPMRA